MKRLTYLFILCLPMLIIACDKSDFEYQNDYEQSYDAWLSFKASSNNSYQYVINGATWAGSSWQTTLTVTNGQVSTRDFRYTVFNDIRMPAEGWTLQRAQQIVDSAGTLGAAYSLSAEQLYAELNWKETGAEVGTREGTSAATPRTLDEIYEMAKNQWLTKRKDAETYFETKNNGMISSCGYVPNGCMDDCFNGISISSIEAI